MVKRYELKPLNQKSFYGKAFVEVDGDTETLYSYNTRIMYRKNGTYHAVWNGWSATTGKHIRAFSGMNKREYMRLLEDND